MGGIKLKTVIHGSFEKSNEYKEEIEKDSENRNYKVEQNFTSFFEVSKLDHLLELIRAFRSSDAQVDETLE